LLCVCGWGCVWCRFYCEEALEVVNFKLSPLPQYFIPEPGSISSYKDYILTLPTTDR
jgi:dynein heavy chain